MMKMNESDIQLRIVVVFVVVFDQTCSCQFKCIKTMYLQLRAQLLV